MTEYEDFKNKQPYQLAFARLMSVFNNILFSFKTLFKR